EGLAVLTPLRVDGAPTAIGCRRALWGAGIREGGADQRSANDGRHHEGACESHDLQAFHRSMRYLEINIGCRLGLRAHPISSEFDVKNESRSAILVLTCPESLAI